jgi:hypothetical protein
MKKLILTLALVSVSAVAFGQGRVFIANDNHLVQLTTDTSLLLPADIPSAGKAIPVPGDSGGLIPSGKTIVFGLYGGTASTSLSLLTTVPLSLDDLSITDGTVSGGTFLMPTIAAGSPAFFQVAAWDSAFADPFLAAAGLSYSGISAIFSSTPAAAPAPAPSIDNAPGWGPVVLTAVVPEPSTFALAGLGAAALLIFRRRK